MSTYEPGQLSDAGLDDELSNFLFLELQKIAAAFLGIENILLQELNVEPAKPRDGMVILADGTNWDPGSGAGFYGRSAGAWVKLG